MRIQWAISLLKSGYEEPNLANLYAVVYYSGKSTSWCGFVVTAEVVMIYRRWIEEKLAGEVSRNKVRLLFGARQVGKTVLLSRLMQAGSSVVYNLQDSRLRRRLERNPAVFSREVEALPRRIDSVAVDEVQKVPALLDEVQFLHDSNPNRFQFFLTGSSARRLRSHSSNLLPGRCHSYKLFPVIRPEEGGFAGLVGASIGLGEALFPKRSLEEYLLFGSLPGIRAESPDAAASTLDAYVENYLEEEVRREALVRDVGAFANFLELAALESGEQVNVARLSRKSRTPAATLRNFYQVLVDTFVGYWIYPYEGSSRKRLLTTPRFLFFDLGVRNAAAGIPPSKALLAQQGGRMLEQFIGLELVHRAAYAGRGHSVGFWRTASGAEVDYVWQASDEDIPVEVKWTDNPHPGDARHVETFLREHSDRAKRGVVVCRADKPQQLTGRVKAIPWREL